MLYLETTLEGQPKASVPYGTLKFSQHPSYPPPPLPP